MPAADTDPPRPSLFTTRAGLLIASVATFFGVCTALCREYTPDMLGVLGTSGLAASAWVAGAAGVGYAVLKLARIDARGSLGVATAGGLGLGAFSLLGLALGLLGWLNRPVALAFPLVGWACLATAAIRRRPTRRDVSDWLHAPAAAGWVWLVPVAMLAVAAVGASVLPGLLWKPLDPAPYDVTSYHLQVPREWYDAGRIVPLPHNVFSYFPFNVEVQFLLLDHAYGGRLAPWTSMYAAQFVCLGYAVLMVLAVAGAVGGCDAKSPGSLLPGTAAAAAASAVPWVVMLASVAYVESALMLYTALAVAWAMRAVAGGPFVRPMAVAGVAAGLAAGVKITAVPMLLLAVPAVVAVVAWRTVARRTLLLGCGGGLVAGSLVLAPWLIRTAVWSHGNPAWPVAMSTLGANGFTPAQVERFRAAHSPRPDQRQLTARLGVLAADVLLHWQYGYVLLPAAAVALFRRRLDRQTWLLVGVATITFVVWIGFTHLLPRFLVAVIPIAAIAIGRSGWRWAGWGVAAAMLVTTAAGVVPYLTPSSCPPGLPVPGLFGRTDLTPFLPVDEVAGGKQLVDAITTHDRDVGIVGDAQAFFFQTPSARLHYRTVFNLPGDQPDPVAAWVGPAAEGNADWVLVVNPSEIARLHRTYRSVPSVPPEWESPGRRTFLIPGTAWPPRP